MIMLILFCNCWTTVQTQIYIRYKRSSQYLSRLLSMVILIVLANLWFRIMVPKLTMLILLELLPWCMLLKRVTQIPCKFWSINLVLISMLSILIKTQQSSLLKIKVMQILLLYFKMLVRSQIKQLCSNRLLHSKQLWSSNRLR